jgi:hypothetical protein
MEKCILRSFSFAISSQKVRTRRKTTAVVEMQ